MSLINFAILENLALTATPSSGYSIAYDLDGVLKQKDTAGVITPIGSLTNQPLTSVLNAGNDSGTFSLIMGTSTSLKSNNGTGQLKLDYNGTSDTILLSTDGTLSSGAQVYLSPNYTDLSNYSNYGTVSIKGGWSSSISRAYSTIEMSNFNNEGRISIETLYGQNIIELVDSSSSMNLSSSVGTMSLGVSNNEIRIIHNAGTTFSSGSGSKSAVFISSQNSFAGKAVYNSPVIGGIGLTAYSSNTVYLGNSVNINNKYTLPSVDGTNGQVLKTDGAGIVTWGQDSSSQNLSDVLTIGNDTINRDIIMGTSTSLRSSNSQNRLFLDRNGVNSLVLSTDNGILSTTALILDPVTATLSSPTFSIKVDHSIISVSDLQGLKYSANYSASFVNRSLVDKEYVDNIVTPLYSPFTAFVDVTYGNNSTALVNRFDKPYSTVSAATLGLTTSSVTNGVVHIRRGNYTETVNLYNGYKYYCEPGVNFTQGGFRDLAGTGVSASIWGYANFIGTSGSLQPLLIAYGSTIDFEFNEINNTGFAIRITDSKANVRGNKLYSRADTGHAISIRGNSTVNMNISESIKSPYRTVDVSNSFSGILNLECPTIESTTPGNSGYVQNFSSALFVDNTVSGTINVRGSLVNGSDTTLYTSFADSNTRYDGSVTVLAGYVSIIGDVDAGETKGVMILGTSSNGQFKIKGDVESFREAILVNSNVISTYLSEGTLKSWGSGSNPYTVSLVSSSPTVYIKNSSLWNTKNNSSIVYVFSTYSTVGIYDTLGYSTGTTGDFIYTTQSVNVGFHSVRSNKDNNILVTDTFSPSGFIYDTGLFIPNF